MLNAIRMECYRLFRTRSMYVIWLVMIGVIFLSTIAIKQVIPEMEAAVEEQEKAKTENNSEESVPMSIGSTPLLMEDGHVTVTGMLVSDIQGASFCLIIAVFSILFVGADMNNGYIKNIAGQVRRRSDLVIAKLIPLLLFTVLTMVIAMLVCPIAMRMIFGELYYGDLLTFLPYLGVQVVLHYGVGVLCMMFAIVIRSNVWGIMVAIGISVNLTGLLLNFLNILIKKVGINHFDITEYTLTGQIRTLMLEMSGKEVCHALFTAVGFIAVATMLSCVNNEKRDVV